MKIVSLNAYAGTVFEPLMAFIAKRRVDTDVFCFQEILTTDRTDLIVTPSGNRAKLFQELNDFLPNFQGYFCPMLHDVDTGWLDSEPVKGITLGTAIFVKKSINVRRQTDVPVLNSREKFDLKDSNTNPALAQIVELVFQDRPISICNIHGTYFPSDKLDSPGRLTQSRNTIAAMEATPGEKIIVGDFNLLPDTDSIRMFETAGYRDLIREYRIPSTRGSMNKQLHPQFANGKYGFQEYADYTFVTPGMKITSFEVPDVPVSDHLPMILEIE